MSWMKRAQGGTGPGAGPQPYTAPQPQAYTNQQNMYPNYTGGAGSAPQQTPQQQYWAGNTVPPAPPHQYPPTYQQEYPTNANPSYQQTPQYNHNYTNPGYTNPQQNYQQNYYQNLPPQQNYPPNSGNNDGWEDNWDWGWEESAKQAQKAQNMAQQPLVQQDHVNNANVIEESFVSTNTWNWAMDDKKGSAELSVPPNQEVKQQTPIQMNPVENNSLPEQVGGTNSLNNSTLVSTEEVRTLSDRDMVRERMPNLALGKRFHLDNLTPQWSIESQMSQESSDGPQTHSESTYRSENQSRNSNSPGPNTDNSNFNYSQGLDDGYAQNSEWSRKSDEPTLADETHTGSRRESNNELSYSMQDLSLANLENPSLNNIQMNPTETRNVGSMQAAPAGLPPPSSLIMPPPPPTGVTSPTPSLAARAPAHASQQIVPASTSATLPPPNFGPSANAQNPFKHAGTFAHKAKGSSSAPPGQPYLPPPSGTLTSPAAVGMAVQQSRAPVSFEANLETTPDNSERPDHPAPAAFRPSPAPPPMPDNLEVAPRSDRNEYLQTAHLSTGDYGENADFARGAPPAGPRRMGVGRQEAPYSGGAGDEPPPGLARMVPGQQTEGERGYERGDEDYLERLIDGRAYRRPVGFDRMVPGEPSDADYPQYQDYAPPPYADGNEQRVVTGLDRDFPREPAADARDLTADGSERPRPAPPPADPRDGTMEGENLQDLSAVPSGELSFAREPVPEPAAPSAEPERAAPEAARRSSDSERGYDAEPRRNRHKIVRDHDRDRDKDDRHSRADGRAPRDNRRPDKEGRERRDFDRRDRDESPDARSRRRAVRSQRYDRETEDTDYYNSDKERERRRHREGSYASRPPRHEERYEERGSRARRYPAEPRERERRERRDRHERSYRDIDLTRTYSHRRGDRDDHRRRVTFSRDANPKHDSSRSEGETYSGGSRPESREATATDEDGTDGRRRDARPRRSTRRTVDTYYDGYGAAPYAEAYAGTRAQYEYYARLRLADPAAYMQLYSRLMAARAPDAPRPQPDLQGYGSLGREERGSVHSGRSSTAGYKGNDTYCTFRSGSLRGAPSLRTDLSDRELTTDVSLPNLDSSTVRSGRMTPHRFSTAHVKGSVSSRHIVVVRGAYPVDGRPATVQLVSLPHALAHDPAAAELAHSPGPLVKGVSHKKTAIEYCEARSRGARREAGADLVGYVLIWDLLALLLRQNGVVVGSDIAELLMRNTREHQHLPPGDSAAHDASRRGSSGSMSAEESRADSPARPAPAPASPAPLDEAAALDKLREYLLYGNEQEALEWAMSNKLWGHALMLAMQSSRRARGAVSARFLAATPRRDPLHTLYAARAAAAPPAATCVADERWADWRPHVAIILANSTARPEHTTRTLTVLGDSLASRGLIYCAQFCYVSGGVPFSRHPLAPLSPAGAGAGGAPAPAPRLALLLGSPRAATLPQLATSRAILATEIYEYALSLNRDYVIPELQVYKLILACRLIDGGLYERALAYVETASRAVTAAPALYSPRLLRALADMADRLQYHDPALHETSGEEGGPHSPHSPRPHAWLQDVARAADAAQATSPQSTPQHQPVDCTPPAQHHYQDLQQQQQELLQQQQQQYLWEQSQQYQQVPQLTPPAQAYPEAPAEEPAQLYAPPAPAPAPAPPEPHDPYEEWGRTEEHHAQSYGDSYWQGDTYGYGESTMEGAAGAEAARPMITMPASHAFTDYDDDRPPSAEQQEEKSPGSKGAPKGREESKGEGKRGWFGGILTKLSLRPPNQMILPDDKNPSIVWDAEHKRWRDVADDGSERGRPAPPPPPPTAPRAAPAPPATPHTQHNDHRSSPPPSAAAAPPPPVSNIFKMQKGRHIKKSYVDVFNPGGAASRPLPPAAEVLGPAPAPGPAPAYFVPAPLSHMVRVSMPSSPSPSPSPRIPTPSPAESGVYEPRQALAAEERAGI